MIVGLRSVLAFEHEIGAASGRLLLGQFRMWARGKEIGRFDEVVVLGSVQAEFEQALFFNGKRFFPELSGREPADVFRRIHEKLYGDQNLTSAEYNSRTYGSANLSDLGGASFDDSFVFLLDQPDGQWLLWSDPSLDDIRAAILPKKTFDQLSIRYASVLDLALSGTQQ